jgi:hypothetical protein
MIRTACLAIAGLALLASCGGRTILYTYTKKQVSDTEAIRDRDTLRGTSGVRRATITTRSDGSAILELEIGEKNRDDAMERAAKLGYERVRL